MTRDEWKFQIARVVSLWPAAESWPTATTEIYYEMLKNLDAADVADAITEIASQGGMKPPSAGKIFGRCKTEGATNYEGPGCQCHEVNFWECPAPEVAHGADYMKRRRAELAAARAVATCVREGRGIGIGEMKSHDRTLLDMAQSLNWWGCAEGKIPASAPA